MHLFLGDLSHAERLLEIYQVDAWRHVVFADPAPQAQSPRFGRRVLDLATIPGDEVTAAYLLGGDWTYEALRTALAQIGVGPDRIVEGARPDAVLEALAGLDPRRDNMSAAAFECIYHDVFHRPWYAYPLVVATAVAKQLGLSSLSAAEFGVFTGSGLRNMASLCRYLEVSTGMHYRVLGFDTGAGLPSVADWRDHPELWTTGELVMPDMDALRASLPADTQLVIGDIRDTLLPACMEHVTEESPLGFVALDVDTYSSSVDALRVFELPPSCLLPVVPMYVDDSYVNITQTLFAGEGLAIAEFNERSRLRKIERKVVRTDRASQPWHHAMWFMHAFDHPTRRSTTGKTLIGLNHFYF